MPITPYASISFFLAIFLLNFSDASKYPITVQNFGAQLLFKPTILTDTVSGSQFTVQISNIQFKFLPPILIPEFAYPLFDLDCLKFVRNSRLIDNECPNFCHFMTDVPLDLKWYHHNIHLCAGVKSKRLVYPSVYAYRIKSFSYASSSRSFSIIHQNVPISYHFWYLKSFDKFAVVPTATTENLQQGSHSAYITDTSIVSGAHYGTIHYYDIKRLLTGIDEHYQQSGAQIHPYLITGSESQYSLEYSCDPNVKALNNYIRENCTFYIYAYRNHYICGDILISDKPRCPDDYFVQYIDSKNALYPRFYLADVSKGSIFNTD